MAANTHDLIKSHLDAVGTTRAELAAPAVPALHEPRLDLLKAHIDGYTNKKGTFVQEHDDKRQSARAKWHGHLDGMKAGDTSHLRSSKFTQERFQVQKHGDDEYSMHSPYGKGPAKHTHEQMVDRLATLDQPHDPIEADPTKGGGGKPAPGEKPAAAGAKSPAEGKSPAKAKKVDRKKIAAVADALSNDEGASDEELLDRFQNEFGLTPEQAKAAIALRTAFLTSGPGKEPDLAGAVNKAKAEPAPAAGAAPPPHAHTDAIRGEAEQRKASGDPTGEQMNALAGHLDAGDHKKAGTALRQMDSDARDAALAHVHPDHWKSLGMDALHPDQAKADFDKLHPAEPKAGGEKPTERK